jgi:Tol biopolymer transport system component
VRRELAEVWAGAQPEEGVELPRLIDDEWHTLNPEDWVVTDENGEGWLDIQIGDEECLRVYVFQSSKLIKAACPKSAYQGDNVACHLEGTDAFNNTCASQVVIQTLSADIVLEGTWLSVTYLPDRQLSLIMVLEGQAVVQSVTDIQDRTLGEEIVVAEDQFLFTMPDNRLEEIGSLSPRQAQPVEDLPAVLDELDLRPWIYRISDRADEDVQVQLGVPPQIVGVEFPDQVPADSTEDNPATWSVRFEDLDGDIVSAEGRVIEEETGPGSRFEEIRVQLDTDKREDALELIAWCGGTVGVATYELTLIDEAGYRSLPEEFTFRCVEGTPTPTWTPTATPTPSPTATFTPSPTPTITPTSTPVPSGQIYFVSARSGDRELYRMNANGSGVTRLTFVSGDDNRPDPSPDGNRIAFASSRDGDWDIYDMPNTPGGTAFKIAGPGSANEFDPDWSPDSELIAYTSAQDGDYEIYVSDTDVIDGPDVTQLTFNSATDGCPDWSPSGSRIAFSSDRSGNREIYVMNANGTGQTRLTDHPALDNCPTWSPDGQEIAFRSDRDGDAEIWIMDANGSNLRQLTHNTLPDWAPAAWSPSGHWLAFYTNRGGDWEIYLISVDGIAEFALTNNSSYDAYPAWLP